MSTKGDSMRPLTHLEHHVKPAIKEWDRVMDKMPDN
jgi:hypothetical protein